MKRFFLLFLSFIVQVSLYAQEEYYPEGTKWTEIRLDTLKYNSWYSKVGDDWVPNFETIEYYVQGEYTDKHYVLKKVYTNGPEWTDSLTLLISNGESYGNSNCIFVKIPENQGDIICPSEIYQFDWSVGKRLWFQNMLEANTTCFPPCGLFNYGIIDEIKEGDFGGVRPLKYVDLSGKAPIDQERPWLDYADTNGGRIIQGIGITEWNDGECLFGPPDPYYAGYGWRGDYKSRHYRSMLVHFERDGEVLYDVWPEKEAATEVTFTEGQMSTIVLPTEPDAGKGKYYRLDRVEEGKIIFEQELQPRAHVPYIVVPSEDFSIELGAQEVEGLTGDTVSVEGVSFIGTYHREEINPKEGFSVRIIDTTPDCSHLPVEEQGVSLYVGALRAYLLVHWDDPYNPGGTKAPTDKMEIVLRDNPNSLQMVNDKSSNGKCFDLQGRRLSGKPAQGLYIEKGQKKLRSTR